MTDHFQASSDWRTLKSLVRFRPEFFDFDRGLRVGNLEDHERITRILKVALESRFAEPFVTERWGRGVYWRWIGLFPRANRAAKPLSSGVSFGCAKFFLEVDTDDRLVKFGTQIERGYVRAPRDRRDCQLRSDWDWNRLRAGLTPRSALWRDIRRLAREGFFVHAGSWAESRELTAASLPGATALRKMIDDTPARHYCGFQLYYALNEQDVRGAAGIDLVEGILAAFDEVTPVMNACMQVELRPCSG